MPRRQREDSNGKGKPKKKGKEKELIHKSPRTQLSKQNKSSALCQSESVDNSISEQQVDNLQLLLFNNSAQPVVRKIEKPRVARQLKMTEEKSEYRPDINEEIMPQRMVLNPKFQMMKRSC